ncbi:MAG TPA: MBL fold metallo-hydrolase [Firmicutes bacterium]|nr:MBL fold metallo-hydrolase [Bacillota bacterium]
MRLRWFGHACFMITSSSSGVKILTDPFDETVGYAVPSVKADIVTVSHDHFDHNNVKCVEGDPVVVKTPGKHEVKGIRIHGVATYHDAEAGRKRGRNVVFVADVDGLQVCHLGDLGHTLDPVKVGEIGHVDVLMVPVGGNFTIDAEAATKVVDALKPAVVIPMHYKTPALAFPIDPVDKFLADKDNIVRTNSVSLELSAQDIPEERTVYVLSYE